MRYLTERFSTLKRLKSPLLRDSAFQFILSAGTTSITIVQIPLLIKALSISGFGYLVICQAIGAIWSSLTIIQFNHAILAFAPESKHKDSIIKWSSTMTTVNYFFSMFVFSVIVIQTIEIISSQLPSIENTEILALIPIVLSSSLIGSPFLGAVYRVKSRYHEYMAAQLITAVIRLGIVYYCMYAKLSLFETAWVAFLAPEALKTILMWLRIKNELKQCQKLEKGLHLKILRLSAAMNLHAISDLPTQQLDKIILLPFIGVGNIGIYQSIKRIGLLTSMITGPFSGSLFHEYSTLTNSGRRKLALNLFHKTVPLFIIITGLFSLTLWITRSIWIPILLPGAIIDDMTLAGILILYCIASSFVGLHPLLIALKAVKKSLAATIISNLFFLFVAILLAPSMQTLGVIVALYVQIGSIITIKYWLTRKYLVQSCC